MSRRHSRHIICWKKYSYSYPYEKLYEGGYSLAGYAMEHPGLVTSGPDVFLVQTEEITLQWKLTSTSVKLMNWRISGSETWSTPPGDELCLPKVSPSWMANKIVNQYHPGVEMKSS